MGDPVVAQSQFVADRLVRDGLDALAEGRWPAFTVVSVLEGSIKLFPLPVRILQ